MDMEDRQFVHRGRLESKSIAAICFSISMIAGLWLPERRLMQPLSIVVSFSAIQTEIL